MSIRTSSAFSLPLLLIASPTWAAFHTLPLGPTGTPAVTVSGNAIELFDPIRLAPGATIGAPGSINQFALPSNFSIVTQQTTTVMLDGAAIGQTPGVNFAVGDLLDFVLFDSNVNRLVFTTRLTLFPTVNGVQNVYEVNNFLRRGFTGYTAEAAWSRASNADLRLYNAARTTTLFGQGTRLYDPDTVLMQSDINVSEGNPWSGYYYLRTNAPFYTQAAGMLSLYQAGEEGQPLNLQTFAGFRPSAAIFLDSDNDGVSNADEITLGTNPNSNDTDGDGIRDGVELGRVAGVADNDGPHGANQGTNLASFVADADGATTTNPLSADTDGDGIPDGVEDANRNGRIDAGESDPNNPNSPNPQTPTQVPVPTLALVALAGLFLRSARRRTLG